MKVIRSAKTDVIDDLPDLSANVLSHRIYRARESD